MQLFYTENIENNVATLTQEESLHCIKVLRKQEGDAITVVDGKGGWYEGTILSGSKKKCTISIQKRETAYKKRAFHLHIAIAPTHQIARYEWFLEKATELGIDEITPILCFHSERRKVRTDRHQKIILSAMKQSMKAYLPKLNEPIKFEQFIKNQTNNGLKFIAWCDYENNVHLKEKYKAGQDVCILIGPEGDFSEQEVELALENRFEAVGLGEARLRTETAGVAACVVVNLAD